MDTHKQKGLNNRAAILITALWIVAILTVFALTSGRQSIIFVKLTSYNVDRLKAYFLARSGILRALAEKGLEYKANKSISIDALSERWANNSKLFEKRKFGDGNYTIAYEYPETAQANKKNPRLFGLMDEQSKININTAPKETLANLLASFEVDRAEAEDIATAIIYWRDKDDNIATSSKGSLDTIYELKLVGGLSPEIFEKIRPYITVFGDGKVNINTAGEVVLNALFGENFADLASKIIMYRKGSDDIIGTKDDRWFSLGSYVVDREEEGFAEIKNLQEAEWYANIYGITTEGYNRIRELAVGNELQLCASSKTYRAIAIGEVRKVRVKVEAVYEFQDKSGLPIVKFWYQE